jgi:hypothetical protein
MQALFFSAEQTHKFAFAGKLPELHHPIQTILLSEDIDGLHRATRPILASGSPPSRLLKLQFP